MLHHVSVLNKPIRVATDFTILKHFEKHPHMHKTFSLNTNKNSISLSVETAKLGQNCLIMQNISKSREPHNVIFCTEEFQTYRSLHETFGGFSFLLQYQNDLSYRAQTVLSCRVLRQQVTPVYYSNKCFSRLSSTGIMSCMKSTVRMYPENKFTCHNSLDFIT